MGTFQITGSAERKINYDMALIELTFAEADSASHIASKIVMRECEQFLEKLEAEGIPAESIALDNDSVSENYYRDSNKVNAKRKLEIRVPFNMSAINRIRQIVDENEYSIEFSLNYEMSNEAEIREELIKEALLNSKKKAEELADTLGLKVVGVESLETYNRSGKIDAAKDRLAAPVCLEAPQFLRSNKLQAKEEKLSESIEVVWKIE